MSNFIKRNQNQSFPVRTGYSSQETEKAYNKIQEADGGFAGSKFSTVEELKSHYANVLVYVHSHPDNDAVDDHNKDNITDMDAVDWMELLISCHHMHGYRLNGKPLGINSLPVDWHG